MGITPFTGTDLDVAFDAVNRILRFNEERNRQRQILPGSGVLYHYTTVEGLKGIVETNEIWATSAYFLNDSAEVIYGYEVLKEALDGWISSGSEGKASLSTDLAKYLQSGLEDRLLNKIVSPIYLTCFCEDGNLLSQWRSYGASGGYALGFDFGPKNYGRLLRPEPNVYTARLVRVEYERSEQIKRCRTILDAVFPILDEPKVTAALPNVESHAKVNYEAISGIVGEMLIEEALSFKNSAFRVEQEWRLVVRRRELLKQGTDDAGQTPIPVHHRPARGYLVPYVRLIPAMENAKLPLHSIRSGPTLDRLSIILSVHSFLDTNGFRGVRVEQSGIPTRF